jgi:thioredoxin reductase
MTQDRHGKLSPLLKQSSGVTASHGEGAYIHDESGDRYLDFTAGIGVLSTGHCHPRVVEGAREQVDGFGVDRRQGSEVQTVERDGDQFRVVTEEDDLAADYLVLATGANRDLAEELGCEFTDEDVVDVDVDMETSVADAYATGAMVRAEEWQAVISAGDGAAAALNILSKEKGEHFHDFDTPADAE